MWEDCSYFIWLCYKF